MDEDLKVVNERVEHSVEDAGSMDELTAVVIYQVYTQNITHSLESMLRKTGLLGIFGIIIVSASCYMIHHWPFYA